MVVEVQALTAAGVPGVPSRRSALGLDGGRLSMLMAVLDRRAGSRWANRTCTRPLRVA